MKASKISDEGAKDKKNSRMLRMKNTGFVLDILILREEVETDRHRKQSQSKFIQ